MKGCYITLKRKIYAGKNTEKIYKNDEFNRIARELECHINDQIFSCENEFKIFTYSKIAEETGYSFDIVREHCFSIGGGGNGFTIKKNDFLEEK